MGGNPGVPYCWKSNWEIGGNFGNLTKMKSQLKDFFGNFTEDNYAQWLWACWSWRGKIDWLKLLWQNILKSWDINFEQDVDFLRFVQTYLLFRMSAPYISIVENFLKNWPFQVLPLNTAQRHAIVGYGIVTHGLVFHCNEWNDTVHCTAVWHGIETNVVH